MKSIIASLFIFAAHAVAQWSQDPRVNTVWEQPENQGAPVICTDGDGGAIVAWGSDHGIRANRVDKFGYRQWGNNGAPILPVPGPHTPINIIPDGRGGAIIVWEDFTKGFQTGNQDNPENEMYAQRIDRTGIRLWDTSGVVIREFIAKTRIGDFQIVSDDYQTFMISWYDERQPVQWYVQRIDLNGRIAFERNGRAIPHESKVYNGQRRVVSDGNGGMLMARGNDQVGVVLDKINNNGTFPWPLGGIPTYTGGPIDMVSDGHGSAILSGIQFTSGPPNFEAEGRIQHVDSTGRLLWGASGKIFAPDADVETFPAIVSDGAGGALVTWDDTTSGRRARYVARFNRNGEMLWKTTGFRLWLRTLNGPPIFSNSMGSIMWLANDFSTKQGDLYAFRVDSSSAISWGKDGVLIRYRDFEEWPYFLEVTTDNRGGFITVWSERRPSLWQNLTLQQVSVNGKLGDVITSVREDVAVWNYPADFIFYPSFPNPSNSTTKISFALRHPSKVQINVINIRGDRIITLIDRDFAPGKYETQWNGRNQAGKEVSSGVYFIQMVVGGYTQVRKHLIVH
jgi:Secretion system C-terminal sorting domain